MSVVLLILAVAMGFSTGWKITVITAAVVDLVINEKSCPIGYTGERKIRHVTN